MDSQSPRVCLKLLFKNIILHTWKLTNIVPIPKPNKDTDKGTSYRPISLLSVIAKTLEKSLLPYITTHIPNTPMQHGYKTQHSTVTALHTLTNTVANGLNQMAPPARIITVAYDTINIHTPVRKLLQRNMPGTTLSSWQTTSRDEKHTQHIETTHPDNVKTGVAPSGVLSPTLFNIYTLDLPPPSAPVQVMAYADDITITSTHTSTSAAEKYIQPYLHPLPLYHLCNTHTHDTHHLFCCTHIRITLAPLDLRTDFARVTALLVRWTEKLYDGPQARRSTPTPTSKGHVSG